MFFLRDALFADKGVFYFYIIIWQGIYLIYNIVVSLD